MTWMYYARQITPQRATLTLAGGKRSFPPESDTDCSCSWRDRPVQGPRSVLPKKPFYRGSQPDHGCREGAADVSSTLSWMKRNVFSCLVFVLMLKSIVVYFFLGDLLIVSGGRLTVPRQSHVPLPLVPILWEAVLFIRSCWTRHVLDLGTILFRPSLAWLPASSCPGLWWCIANAPPPILFVVVHGAGVHYQRLMHPHRFLAAASAVSRTGVHVQMHPHRFVLLRRAILAMPSRSVFRTSP